jgi:V/A-type H+-transporting ATPase subunit A
MREMSGRLEEIPGEEAFPAYLESTIASFYERAGIVKLRDGSKGSVTIGGTVSPAGGNFEEPVTQATLKVVGAFHGLSRERSDARRYPSIDPLDSWSKYNSIINADWVQFANSVYKRGAEVNQMMKVVGEEGTSLDDFVTYLKSEFLDAVYMQQDSFDEIEGSCPVERQKYVFRQIIGILGSTFDFEEKDDARNFFNTLRQNFIDMNYKEFKSPDFNKAEKAMESTLASKNAKVSEEAKSLLKDGE